MNLRGVLLFGVLAMVSMSGCGGGDSGDAQYLPSVDDLTFRDRSVAAGSTTSARIEFNPGADITGHDLDGNAEYTSSRFTLVVTLPAGTTFVQGTSKITDSLLGDVIFGNPDPRSPDLVGPCGDGRTLLQYNFKRGEFGDPTTLDNGSVFLKFDLSVTTEANGDEVTATSLLSPPISACSVDAERAKALTVN